ncbi:MAG: proton-conducting transporter membrane subunit, partial [Anaerolineaceae bacterium]|nr:proton-conducting transporter membrane subunit [Anaerolineaceae bacterium]
LDRLIVALFVIGFGLKLALVPFYFWLPGVAECASPMTTVLIVSVVDMAAFGELVHLRESAPWIFTDYAAIWLGLALLSMFGGALLALAHRNLKRMLAFSTIDDMGYLLLGVVVGSAAGINGALLAALNHALCKLLLFGAVGVAEYRKGHALTLDDRGLAGAYPVSAAAFIAGALWMLGVPPLFGFAGRWRLYLAGVEYGGAPLVIVMALATGLALLYFVRAIHRVWFGRAEEATQAGEPGLAAAVPVFLIVLLLLAGLIPGWLTGWMG